MFDELAGWWHDVAQRHLAPEAENSSIWLLGIYLIIYSLGRRPEGGEAVRLSPHVDNTQRVRDFDAT